jgi:hypothetical protein
MLVIAQHKIQDTEKFWGTAQAISAALSSDLKLLNVFPSTDLKVATCLWEAPSVMDVQKLLDDNVGSISENFCYEVNEAAAIGLPKMSTEAASN